MPVTNVDATVNLPDSTVYTTSRSSAGESRTSYGDRHLFWMKLFGDSRAEGRYLEDSRAEGRYLEDSRAEGRYLEDSRAEGRYLEWAREIEGFSPLGRIFFRPAGYHLMLRRIVDDAPECESRSVYCLINDDRLRALSPSGFSWGRALSSTLDIRASDIKFHFRRLNAELMFPSFASTVMVDALLILLISDLINHVVPPVRSGTVETLRHIMMKRVRERVYDLTAQMPTIAELANLTGLNERKLLRVFHNTIGISIVEYIRRARIEKAQELLSISSCSLREIADNLGFSSHSSFTTSFTREVGLSPKEFRRQHRRVCQC